MTGVVLKNAQPFGLGREVTQPGASPLTIGVKAVQYDEPALRLEEVNIQSPGSRGWHRYQIIHVMRDGMLAEFRTDLGRRGKFKADQFRIPAAVKSRKTGKITSLHTVGELCDIADWMRSRPSTVAQVEPSNFAKRAEDEFLEAERRRKHQSTVGPAVRIERR